MQSLFKERIFLLIKAIKYLFMKNDTANSLSEYYKLPYLQ